MGNAGERPRTSIRQTIGCTEMRAQVMPAPLSLTNFLTISHTNTPSAKGLEVAGQNSHQNPLDTLAQLVPTRKLLQKRARSKYITNSVSIKLAALGSVLEQSYWNSYHCCGVLRQSGKSVVGKYCNNRWCLTCNRIRTAKLINGYAESLRELPDKRFVTLTIPNVSGESLKKTIEKMVESLVLIQKSFRKRKVKIVGIRKLECTYNPARNDFHPHFHLIVSGETISKLLIDEWLKRFPSATREAQNEKPADDNSAMELFKYFTKIVTKKRFYISALDTIFTAMYGKRTFQPMGIKKIVSEDISELQKIVYEDLEERESLWTWVDEATDWIDFDTGETLTGYSPSEAVVQLINTC